MIPCPVCRAENTSGPGCRRCRADLTLIFDLQLHHDELLTRAKQFAAAGNWPEVVAIAEQAVNLRKDSASLQVAAIGWLMLGDYPRAWKCYQGLQAK